MILILSEQNDLSTTQVIEWLDFFNKKWFRINRNEQLKLKYLGVDIEIQCQEEKFKLSEITSVWYRRGLLNTKFSKLEIKEIDSFLQKEDSTLTEYLYYKLSKIHHLDTIKNAFINKLIVSEIASEIGLLTPKTYIFSNGEHLKRTLSKKDEIITKSIYGEPFIYMDNISIRSLTCKIDSKKIEKEDFFPSLIQKYIEKKYELRIFYMKGNFYSMAIFSQNEKQTKWDFRDYNTEKPNRRIPIELPLKIKKKLNKLMLKLQFDTGSIDMIYTPQGDYVFLEVNPLGQFSMTSFPCNYNIEKKIAEFL